MPLGCLSPHSQWKWSFWNPRERLFYVGACCCKQIRLYIIDKWTNDVFQTCHSNAVFPSTLMVMPPSTSTWMPVTRRAGHSAHGLTQYGQSAHSPHMLPLGLVLPHVWFLGKIYYLACRTLSSFSLCCHNLQLQRFLTPLHERPICSIAFIC